MRMLQEDDPLFENWDQDDTALAGRYGEQQPGRVADELERAGSALADRFDQVGTDGWFRPGRRSDGATFTVESPSWWMLRTMLYTTCTTWPRAPGKGPAERRRLRPGAKRGESYSMALVRPDFAVPPGAATALFVLEPLGPQHNAADLAAWTSSIAHKGRRPGSPVARGRTGPFLSRRTRRTWRATPRTSRNGLASPIRCSIQQRAKVVGCVYLYPPRRPGYDVDVRSWVTADHADLDKPLYAFVCEWLARVWPFNEPDYAVRRTSLLSGAQHPERSAGHRALLARSSKYR